MGLLFDRVFVVTVILCFPNIILPSLVDLSISSSFSQHFGPEKVCTPASPPFWLVSTVITATDFIKY